MPVPPSGPEQLAFRVLITLLIVGVGIIAARLAGKTIRTRRERQLAEKEVVQKIRGRQRPTDQIVSYAILVVSLSAAMVYLNASVAESLYISTLEFIPNVITAVLVFFLGYIVVTGVMRVVRTFVRNVDVAGGSPIGVSPKVLDLTLSGIKAFLLVVVLELSVIQLGISPQIIDTTLTAASYGLVALLVLLGFFGFRGLVQNYAAGLYLRGSDVLKPGKSVKLDDETGEIRDIGALGTTISTDSGYFMLAPNHLLMGKEILFKRVKADIETLEDIKNYFVVQDTDQAGPASAEMALAMLGFDVEQNALAPESKTPSDLIEAVMGLTDTSARAARIEYRKITELSDELKTWFNEGALVIPRFSRNAIFPQSDEDDYYSLAVGSEGEEVLMVDPSARATGGVYYVEAAELDTAMSEIKDEERGYIVIAPKGTTAYWRIKEGLLYADKHYYEDLSKTLETRLRKLLREGRILKDVMPSSVQDYIDEWRRQDHVSRVWNARTKKTQEQEDETDEATERHEN